MSGRPGIAAVLRGGLLVVAVAGAPGCVFCSLDRTRVTVVGVPADARAACPASLDSGRVTLMPRYLFKVYHFTMDAWWGAVDLRPDDERGPGPWIAGAEFSWRSGARYGVVYETKRGGWCAVWLPPDASPREWVIPFLTCPTAKIDVTGATVEARTTQQKEDIRAPDLDEHVRRHRQWLPERRR